MPIYMCAHLTARSIAYILAEWDCGTRSEIMRNARVHRIFFKSEIWQKTTLIITISVVKDADVFFYFKKRRRIKIYTVIVSHTKD